MRFASLRAAISMQIHLHKNLCNPAAISDKFLVNKIRINAAIRFFVARSNAKNFYAEPVIGKQ
jgi:hypothetical protein